ncbi:hypothetical protein JW960_25890 [candidate division KSB1 bacterium]|nr:hypothetical protein [candidate division KSB1 bacterium]
MNKRCHYSLYFAIIIIALHFETANAQERPFLFTFVTPDAATNTAILHYDAAYGRQTFEPLGGGNFEQTFGIHTGLSESLTLIARLGLAHDNASTQSSQHVELLKRVLGSQSRIVDFSFGPGIRHEYSGTNVLLGRAVIGRHFNTWQLFSNCLLEKPLSNKRDEIDLFLTMGWSYQVTPSLQFGLEAVGQDLEGFWLEEETEGGAVLFIGPTIVADVPFTALTVTLGGGPIVRATKSVRTSLAPRDLQTSKEDGYVVRAAFNYKF